MLAKDKRSNRIVLSLERIVPGSASQENPCIILICRLGFNAY